MLDELLSLVVPPRCAACGAPGTRAATVLCAACRRALPWLCEPRCRRCALPGICGLCPARAAAFDVAWAAVAYDGTARVAIRALKLSAARPLAGEMAAQMAAGAPPGLLAGSVVAVPSHPARRRARGFDPAELIARSLARRCRLRYARRALRRTGPAVRQAGAGRRARLAPGRLGVRACGPTPPVVVLVDDVHTTGATLNACALALRAGGTERVVAITWARTL